MVTLKQKMMVAKLDQNDVNFSSKKFDHSSFIHFSI